MELDYYFKINPSAKVTGIDLAPGMFAVLKKRFSDKDITLIQDSYFDMPFGEYNYDTVVSVESLYHFKKEEKTPLYCKIYKTLKTSGYFILTDYFASSNEVEIQYQNELNRLKPEQGITNNEFYHYDISLTVLHETQILTEAGFSSVDILNNWGATYTLKASK